MSSPEGTLLYHHNITDALTGSDTQVRQTVQRVAEVDPDSFFLSEAYDANAPTSRVEHVAEDLQKQGYAIQYGSYSEPGRPDQHGFVAGVRGNLLAGHFGTTELAGRVVVEAAMFEKSSGIPFAEVEGHFGDHKARRQLEFAAFSKRYGAYIEHGGALVLSGDLNNAIDETSAFARAMRVGAAVANTCFAGQAKLVEMGDAHGLQKMIGRIASLLIRGADQLDGEDIRRLIDTYHFTDANTEHLPTSFVPHLPGALLKAVSTLPPLERWLLGKPHIEADHIMATKGTLTDFTVYQRLPGDEHLATSARYSLLPAQAGA